jgi:thioredoxin reductase
MMPDRSIIIGAGLAGLSTGCYARMNGYSSRIFEHHSVPGGGVPPCLPSGRHVVQILCKRDRKQFETSVP